MAKPVTTTIIEGTNPFQVGLIIPVSQQEIRYHYVEEGGIKVPALQENEATPFIRLYVDPSRRKFLMKLPLNSRDLLWWFMMDLKYGKDYLWINWKRYQEESGVKERTCQRALAGLIKHQVLQLSGVKDTYWFNAHYFFKGSRLKSYPDNLINPKSGKKVVPQEMPTFIPPAPVAPVIKLPVGIKFDFDDVEARKAA